MSHTVKLFERIINHMLRTIVDLGNIHSVFRRGRSTMDPALRTLTHRSGISVIGMVLHVMFRLMIVRMRPESGNFTYMTGRRPTRALEVQ